MVLGLSFGNGITLIHFEQQKPRLFTAGDHLDCRYIRAFFKRQGMTATQYIEPNLSNIYDTTADIAALGNEIIALHVTPSNYRLCKRLTSTLKEQEGRNRVIWFGNLAAVIGEEVFGETEVDGLVRWSPERTLSRLVNTEVEGWSAVNGFTSRAMVGRKPGGDSLALPAEEEAAAAAGVMELDELTGVWEDMSDRRRAAMLSVKCADQLGNPHYVAQGIRRHSPERLQRDLELAVRTSRQTAPVITIEGFDLIRDEAQREQILEVLEEAEFKAGYKLTVPLEACTYSMLERFKQCGVEQLQIKVPLGTTPDAFPKEEAINYMIWQRQTSQPMTFSVTLTDDGNREADPSLTAELLHRWITEGVIEAVSVRAEPMDRAKAIQPVILPEALAVVMLEHLTTEQPPFLLNEYTAYMTGYYPQQAIGGGVKHIGLTEPLEEEVPSNYFGEYTALNSALIYEYNQVYRGENPSYIYYDSDGVWKRSNRRFEELSEAADKEEYYLSNAHQVVQTEGTEYILQLNDFLQVEPIRIRQMGYSEAATRERDRNNVEFQMLRITSTEDLEAYLEDVDHFSRTGTFRHGYEIQSYLVDSCRWSGAQTCTVKQLPRLFVDGNQAVSGCRGCAAIGTLDDSMDRLLLQTAVVSDREQLVRGCATCEINASCTKCSFLPAYMNRQQYCNIRKKHNTMHLYMQTIEMLKGLNKYSQALDGLSVDNFRMSLPTCTHKYPYERRGNVRSAVADTVLLFFIGETPAVYQTSSQKLLRLSEPMALLLEGMMAGANRFELKQALRDRYQVEEEQADQIISQATDLFMQEGCLKHPVAVL
ncbi:hypothetical protein NST99_32520 [Paenibacillus sp. FSL L8-0470]|uniref:hypothetical protein n=1 Tax=Paenibacillus sp. FSL L8-0470 TaxID=2954688 RepID=UPI0030F8A4F3